MKLSQLIEQLKACTPTARVLIDKCPVALSPVSLDSYLVRALGFLPYASAGLDEDIVSMVVEAEEALRDALEKKQ